MIEDWFLSDIERANPASDIRSWTTGNTVEPLIDGAQYFPRLHEALCRARAHDQIYLADFRGDTDELLDGAGTSIGAVLIQLARRGVTIFGLIWRSQPDWLDQSECANAELARDVSDAGGEVLLDARTRRAGSHHQKFVVIRHPATPMTTSRSSAASISATAETTTVTMPAIRRPWNSRPCMGRHHPGTTCRPQSAGLP